MSPRCYRAITLSVWSAYKDYQSQKRYDETELNFSTVRQLVDNPFYYRTVKTTLAVQHVVVITYYLRKEGLSNYQVTSRLTACLN